MQAQSLDVARAIAHVRVVLKYKWCNHTIAARARALRGVCSAKGMHTFFLANKLVVPDELSHVHSLVVLDCGPATIKYHKPGMLLATIC